MSVLGPSIAGSVAGQRRSHRDAVGTQRIRVVGDWLAALCVTAAARLCG
jgi:hypothetical protein